MTVRRVGWGRGNSEDTGWITATLQNSWVYYGSPYTVPAYRRLDGVVYLKGLLKSGTFNVAAFTLPAGFRPLEQRGPVIVASNGAYGFVDVLTTGVVQFQAGLGTNAYVSLDEYPPFIAEA